MRLATDAPSMPVQRRSWHAEGMDGGPVAGRKTPPYESRRGVSGGVGMVGLASGSADDMCGQSQPDQKLDYFAHR